MKIPAYPALDGLFDLARRDGVDIRPTLLRVLTDLYVQKPVHTALEQTQYSELALGLIAAVDDATRAAVVSSLSRYQAAPAAVLQALGQAIPPRNDDAAPRAAANADLTERFFMAGSEERRLILSNLDVSNAATTHQTATASSDIIQRLEAAAYQHNTGEFGRVLERALNLSSSFAARIARDPLGEPIAVAAKALGMAAPVFQRILLFLNPSIGQSIQRVHDLADYYEILRPDTAASMVALWQRPAVKSRPAYQPVHWDDERRNARSMASPAARRVSPTRFAPPARLKDRGN